MICYSESDVLKNKKKKLIDSINIVTYFMNNPPSTSAIPEPLTADQKKKKKKKKKTHVETTSQLSLRKRSRQTSEKKKKRWTKFLHCMLNHDRTVKNLKLSFIHLPLSHQGSSRVKLTFSFLDVFEKVRQSHRKLPVFPQNLFELDKASAAGSSKKLQETITSDIESFE